MHPAQHQRDGHVPINRRPRERVAGGMFSAVTRVAGLRPGLLPDHLIRQLYAIGVADAQIHRVLPSLRSLGDWPYRWEAEADARAAEGDWAGAFAAYYVAQRVLLTSSVLKDRLYALARHAYERVAQPPIERLSVRTPSGETVAAILQLPAGSSPESPVPTVLMVPGVTGTKEELHAWAIPMLRRGWAVARLDNPGYGETSGVLDIAAFRNPAHVLSVLADDARLDSSSMHLHGMSLGAYFAMISAPDSPAATVTLLCPPYRPNRYFEQLPTLNLTALQYMTGMPNVDKLGHFISKLNLIDAAHRTVVPVRIFHGGRDRTVPVQDGIDLARQLGHLGALTIYERDHHNCMEHVDDITAETMEFLRDPFAVCARLSSGELAELPTEPAATRGRTFARLPFIVPWARPRVDQQHQTT